MVIEKKVATKYIDGIERIYIYIVTQEKQDNILEYGVKAIREDISNGQIVTMIENEVKYISPKKSLVKGIMDILFRNEVSPIHLKEVVCEYVDVENIIS
jgi:hypothetical protein